MNNQNSNIVEFFEIPNADHFFANKWNELGENIKRYIDIRLATRITKPVRKKRRRRRKKDSVI
jgi:hypothetical protein